MAIVLNGGDLPQGVDFLQVPLWLHLQVNVDLLKVDALSSRYQTHSLEKREKEKRIVTLSLQRDRERSCLVA